MTYTDNTIEAIKKCNESIEVAKRNDFDTEQVKALNLGNLVTILSAIAVSLGAIADKLDKRG